MGNKVAHLFTLIAVELQNHVDVEKVQTRLDKLQGAP